ncbi:DUF4139 domain-containing protein [Phaeobacter gallaeciensis]|uniref:Mucoidy inhibitor MuiA family protein n=1 Tax=Phaeobacter gallaeciensis TaxID=60890 RepID=A0AAD0EBD8_9RHOB|nr:DUF4139 domain-containing protein [Phaeobacter gallaeciensis]AHD07905.1 hypothetical protein Gal_00102 [Phaeobacter gallaeciensis DSM 26640]ATE91173.1 hypothetical protein PhaeoP11_00101 [Phaeobacter gallaeciensis]ATE95448.1 hypothetical protein PhaeoP73_00101 [Phaeobacter gallaeciensis]ATE99787.1 hypothetical protein PhaeoP75_00101 [Phaeobacter gallaeciensis]ATF04220.1 hypothetical protein PhaeoP63_00101 [Phaeobacter gallaeciensis]
MRSAFSVFTFGATLAVATHIASAGVSDVIQVDSQVVAVTLYPGLAQITRTADVVLPEGQHELILQGVPRSAETESLQVQINGARRISTRVRDEFVPPRDASTPEIQAAEARIDEIEAQITTVEDEAARARATAHAARSSIHFLEQLGNNDGLVDTNATALADIALMISRQAGENHRQIVDAEAEARNKEQALVTLQENLTDARAALAALTLEDEERLYIEVTVEAAAAGATSIRMEYLTEGAGNIGWSPSYELHLATGSDPELTLNRSVILSQDTGENWQDVALTLSTADPLGQSAPSRLFPQLRRIEKPMPVPEPKQRMSSDMELDLANEPIIEAAVVVEEMLRQWSVDRSGVAAVYEFDTPVSVASGAEALRLEMDSLKTAATLTAQAVPLRNETAYRMVRFTNEFGEQLLAATQAAHFVDGKLVAVADFAGLAPGAEADLGFGAIRGLTLSRDILDQSEGEQGLISRNTEQVRRVEIEVENLTNRAWPLRLLDRVPYSQQDALEITWDARPAPTEENVEKQRGILAWDMEIAAGATEVIEIDTELSWPEGQILR